MPFTGETAEIPVGIDGLTGTKNLSTVSPGQLLIAENITYEAGTIGKEGGSAKQNSTAITGTPSILGGWDWHPAAGTSKSVVLGDDGALYKDDGVGNYTTTLKSGLTINGLTVPVFVEGGDEVAANDKKLFIFTGRSAVQVLAVDGATTSDITAPPADWSGANQPTFGLIHEGSLWGGGNLNDPHRLYKSLASDQEDFTTTPFSISVHAGEGERITGAISFKGVIVCWKYPRGIYIIDTTDADSSNWKALKHSTSIGGVSPLGHVAVDNDVLFIDGGGNLHFISAITAFGNIGSRNASDVADLTPLLRDEINLAQLFLTQAIYYVAKREAHFTMASSGTNFNRRLVADFNRADLLRFRLSTKDINRSIWLASDNDGIPRPRTGDASGFVWDLDQETRSINSLGYTGKFQTPHSDLSHLDPALGTLRKQGKFLELVVEPKGNWDLSVDILWDDVIQDTVTFNMGSDGAALGSFVLGTDKLAGTILLNKRKRIVGGGRRISFIGRNSGAAEDFSVSKFFLMFKRSNTRGAESS